MLPALPLRNHLDGTIESNNSGFDTDFFRQFTQRRGLQAFARLDMPAGKRKDAIARRLGARGEQHQAAAEDGDADP